MFLSSAVLHVSAGARVPEYYSVVINRKQNIIVRRLKTNATLSHRHRNRCGNEAALVRGVVSKCSWRPWRHWRSSSSQNAWIQKKALYYNASIYLLRQLNSTSYRGESRKNNQHQYMTVRYMPFWLEFKCRWSVDRTGEARTICEALMTLAYFLIAYL